MKAQYYIPSQGEDITDARGDFDTDKLWAKENDAMIREIAEEAAEHEFNQCDGWEWMGSEGEVEIAVVIDGSYAGKSLVTIEMEPVFYANKSFDLPGEK